MTWSVEIIRIVGDEDVVKVVIEARGAGLDPPMLISA